MSQKYYKVWLEIEECDEDGDTFPAAVEPAVLQYNFSSLERAQAAREFLVEVWEKIPSHLFSKGHK
jgi:hypothetical protein